MANRKPQLPKSVLDMKFMKKSKERIQKELENIEDHGSLYTNTISNAKRGNYITESSFIYCEDLMEGRLSFKGMNPEIERLMELEKEPIIPEEDMKKDVSDEILVKKMEAFKQRKRPYSSPSTAGIKKKKR